MLKRLALVSVLAGATATVATLYARQQRHDKERRLEASMQEALKALPDSAFSNVSVQDLLDDKIYLQLQREGWSRAEIEKIMNTALRNRKQAKGKAGYVDYAKEWLPFQRLADLGGSDLPPTDVSENGDSISNGNGDAYDDGTDIPTTDPDAGMNAGEFYNKAWNEIEYTPNDRLAGRRNPGYWRPVKPKPSSGRVLWAAWHPTDPDKIMFVGDGAGLWRTDDSKNWRNITDNIPDRNWRYTSFHSAIPVDPDDWNHVFAFMNVSARGGATSVWETKDGGNTWRRIQGATHGFFKRGYCFRDADGNLKFIGAVRENWSIYPGRTHNRLLISEDTCKTWTNLKDQLTDPDGMDLRDTIPPDMDGRTTYGLWFQQVEFDPKDRNRIYIPTSRSILYFDDGARSTIVGGKRRYNLRKMRVRVHGRTLDTPVRNADTPYRFPVASNAVGHMVIDPDNPNRMWYATGDQHNRTALFFTENRGEDWITLYDKWAGIGRTNSEDTGVFGNEVAWTWLGGFGVNLKDNRWLYGTSQSSSWSETDWLNGEEVVYNKHHWGGSIHHQHDDGNYYLVSNARHTADNHFMLSHRSGRVMRGSDGGLLIKDLTINDNRWTSIGYNANEMCNYRVQCNEFGDQAIISNTQDIDIQTYRYGRWGLWHGYEGSNSCINPYANTGYWSGSGGLQGLDPMAYSGNSWASVITRADVVNSTFYMLNTTNPEGTRFTRWDDLGRGGVGLDQALGGVPSLYNWGLCRDKGRCTIYALIGNTLRRSVDQGNTWDDALYGNATMQLSGAVLATDPDNSNVVYLGQRGKVVRANIANATFETLTTEGLPNIDCGCLLFHEGTGDLYFANGNDGMYYLQNGASEWKFWLKGYNTNHANSPVINYTTQEMYQCDYGRGIFAADLQRPADRYFRNGFALKELSNIDGYRTIGIDTKWTIPLYYNYRWTVNGVDVEHPYQNLTRDLRAGDRVQLTLTLRESPDVSTRSAVYTVPDTRPSAMSRTAGRALYSDGNGRVDIGFTDLFYSNFTVDLWVKPQSDGCIIGNRQAEDHLGAKGWILCLEGGTLRFRYSPRHRFHAPRYEQGDAENIWSFDCGRPLLNQWHHIAVTQQRDGLIQVYVDGNLAGQAARVLPDASLNSSLCLSLFGDGIDRYPMRGYVDELKVWKRVLTQEEIRREMFSTNASYGPDLAMHYSFNNASLADNTETYSGYVPHPRTRAVTEARVSNLPIGAKCASIATAVAAQPTVFGKTPVQAPAAMRRRMAQRNDMPLMTVTTARQQNINMGVYAYDTRQWKKADDNLNSRYFTVDSTAYLIHSFDPVSADERADIVFYPYSEAFNSKMRYRLYWSESDTEKEFWNLSADLTYDAANGTLVYANAPLGQLQDKKLMLVIPNPALEVRVDGLHATGEYRVYAEEQATVGITARTLQGLEEPLTSYEVKTDNGLLTPQGSLNFLNNEAAMQMKLDLSLIPQRNASMTTVLSGKTDDKMIPLPIKVVNCITSPEAGTCTTINGGVLQVGNANSMLPITGTRSMTMMGWMRYDGYPEAASGGRYQLMWLGGWGFMSKDGYLRVRYNNDTSREMGTPYALNTDSEGNWVHMAMVADENAVRVYINGVLTNSVNAGLQTINASGGLLLGAPATSFRYFRGAFDQVSMWSRALTQAEIVKYMQQRVTLNAEGLVSYITMDEADVNAGGQMVDLVSGQPVQEYGSVVRGTQSTFTYNPQWTAGNDGGALAVAWPAGKQRGTVVSGFMGESYNYLNTQQPDLLPLNREHYTVAYTDNGNVASSDNVTITYSHPTVTGTEPVKMALRSIGTTKPYAQYIECTAVESGKATFSVPYSLISAPVEAMFFVPRTEQVRNARVDVALDDPGLAVKDGRVMLRDNETCIPVTVRLLSGQPDAPVQVYVRETEYARPDVESLNLSTSQTARFNLLIDRSKLASKLLNPVNLTVVGMDGGQAAFSVYLEPKVNLRLKNGVDANNFTATTVLTQLDIEAELVQGWLEKNVELEITTPLKAVTSISNGNLLSTAPAHLDNLQYVPSYKSETLDGWNLIGNPYLTNINLTKEQNVSYDPNKVTKFVYHCNPQTGNYVAYDMTKYDNRHAIHPFQSYFVQTMADAARLTVTPVAKEEAVSKRTMAHAVEETFIDLVLESNGNVQDMAVLKMADDARTGYVLNEDAPKLFSLRDDANQLFFSVGGNQRIAGTEPEALTISTVPPNDFKTCNVGVTLGNTGIMEIRLREQSHNLAKQTFVLTDNYTGESATLVPGGEGLRFLANETGRFDNRFSLRREGGVITGAEDAVADNAGYLVEAENGVITVSGLHGNATVAICRPNGIEVASQHTSDSVFRATVLQGFYIVTIKENNKEYSTKIAVK